jgi:4-diphosphocytidyl-2C-methyl-D-erythritol kinase
MPTPEVYKRFDEMGLGTDLSSLPPNPSSSSDPCPLTPDPSLLINDLEPPAFSLRPDLARLRSDIEQSLSRPVRMSGSGSTLFSLYDSPTEASEAALLVMQRHGTTALAADLAPVVKPLGSQSH